MLGAWRNLWSEAGPVKPEVHQIGAVCVVLLNSAHGAARSARECGGTAPVPANGSAHGPPGARGRQERWNLRTSSTCSSDWGSGPEHHFYSVLGVEAAVRTRKWTLLAVCLTTFMLLLDITVVVVALPSMQERFDASLTGLQWFVDAYALSLAALILTAGALADRYGRRLLFIAGVLLFTLSSLLCGLAWSITALDVARALQGIGGAALFATALALIGHEYRGADRFGALAVGAPRWAPP